MGRPIPESYWVEPGRFLAGEYAGGFLEGESRRLRLEAFLEAGITCFIDLTQPDELPSYEEALRGQAAVRGLPLSYRRYPIRDRDVPHPTVMSTILDSIDETLTAGRALYVHCWGGVGRTGTVVGCHLVRSGRSGPQALERLEALWSTVPKRRVFPRTPETDRQVEYILGWTERGHPQPPACGPASADAGAHPQGPSPDP